MPSTTGNLTDSNLTAGDTTTGLKTNFNDNVLPAHGLNKEQLASLNDAVQDLETHLLHCVDDVHQDRWPAGSPLKKHAELRLRELVVCHEHDISKFY